MKKSAQKTGAADRPHAHLGGLTARKFLRGYWQKKPLLIRNAFANFVEPLTRHEVFELAQRDEAESRLIARSANGWTLQQGPFTQRDFRAMKHAQWTVLIQDTQHFSGEAHDLLACFNFIPHARVDDLMVSYAGPGGGVGPHFDSYDVFLLQGSGRRRWQISNQLDLRLKQGVPLKILAHFKAEQEFVLESGDMLYLPPRYAHNGIAETECLTWSIGFRAPSDDELAGAFLDHLADRVALEGRFGDPGREPVRHAGEIPADFLRHALRTTDRIRWRRRDVQEFAGRYLTEPKAHVFFTPPRPRLSLR